MTKINKISQEIWECELNWKNQYPEDYKRFLKELEEEDIEVLLKDIFGKGLLEDNDDK